MSAREDILVYLAGRLATVTGVTVFRSRESAVAREEGVVLILKPEEESVTKVGNGIVARDLVVSITAIARAAVPDTTIDPILANIQTAILGDVTLGGKAAACIEQSTRWNFEVADQTALVVEVRYSIKYLTPTGSFGSIA